HQHRSPTAPGPPPAADLEAVQVGQPEVEHRQVVVEHGERLEGGGARSHDIRRPGRFPKRPPDEIGNLRLVFDHQYPHLRASTVSSPAPSAWSSWKARDPRARS